MSNNNRRGNSNNHATYGRSARGSEPGTEQGMAQWSPEARMTNAERGYVGPYGPSPADTDRVRDEPNRPQNYGAHQGGSDYSPAQYGAGQYGPNSPSRGAFGQTTPYNGSAGQDHTSNIPGYGQTQYGPSNQQGVTNEFRQYGRFGHSPFDHQAAQAQGYGPGSQDNLHNQGTSYDSGQYGNVDQYSYASQIGGGQNSLSDGMRNTSPFVGGLGQPQYRPGVDPYRPMGNSHNGQPARSHWTLRGQRQPQLVGKGPKGYTRHDERIQDDIHERLSHGFVDCSEVEVTVANGMVMLSGHVDSKEARRTVEDLVEDVLGVNDVDTRIKVVAGNKHAPSRSSESSAKTERSSVDSRSTGHDDGQPNSGTTKHPHA